MALPVKRLVVRSAKRHEADATRGVATRVLETAELPDQLSLASAFGAAVKRVNVVEHVNEHIQPIVLGAAKLLDFEAERGSFAFVDFLHERREFPNLSD